MDAGTRPCPGTGRPSPVGSSTPSHQHAGYLAHLRLYYKMLPYTQCYHTRHQFMHGLQGMGFSQLSDEQLMALKLDIDTDADDELTIEEFEE